MSWTMVLLVFVGWCVVSVVAGLVFAFFFGGMNRIHPDELDKVRLEEFRRQAATAEKSRAKRHKKGRTGARASYRPLPVGGAPHPPLEDE